MVDGWQGWGVLLLPCFSYLLYHRWYLNDNELNLLLTSCCMLTGLLMGGWPGTLTYLLAIGYHNILLLQSARGTGKFQRDEPTPTHSACIETLFMSGENEIKLLPYLICFWVLVRVTSLKSLWVDLGNGRTVLSSLSGWNCLLLDWTVIYSLWLILLLLAALACYYLIVHDLQTEVLYKTYLLKYKIAWDLGINGFVVAYHYWAYLQANSLKQCLQLYQNDSWARCMWMWGMPLSTLLFFWAKQGLFQQRGTSQTEGESQHQKQLNQMIIDREFKRVQASSQQR